MFTIAYEVKDDLQPYRVITKSDRPNIAYFASTKKEAQNYIADPSIHNNTVRRAIKQYSGR